MEEIDHMDARGARWALVIENEVKLLLRAQAFLIYSGDFSQTSGESILGGITGWKRNHGNGKKGIGNRPEGRH
jgi:hypothetical protein